MPVPVVLVSHRACAAHDTGPGHPEAPGRHHGRPPMILRVRYPLAEPPDPVVVLDTPGRR